jgi:hypothetical protein
MSLNDEYFRLAMVARREAADHPDVLGGVLDAAMRGLQRPASQGLTTTFLRSVQMVAVRSPAGLHFGAAAAFEPDAARIMAVVARIVRGLYFHHTQCPLGSRVEVLSIEDTLSDLDRIQPSQRTALIQLVQAVGASEWRHVGRAFSYAYVLAESDPLSSVWLMRFYRATTFLSLTRPEQSSAHR